jgi:hypothetical protein
MNLNDKNIDQVFRDAAQNSDAPRYDHSYWKEVNSMLNSEDKRKRGFILWSIAGSIIALLLVSTLFIVNEKGSDILVADKNDTSIDGSRVDYKKEAFEKEFTQNHTSNGLIASKEPNKIKGDINKSISTNINNNVKKVERFANTTKPNESENTLTSNKEDLLKSDSRNSSSTENNSIESNISSNNSIGVENNSDLNEDRSVGTLLPRVVNLEQSEISRELLPFKLPKVNSITFYAKLSAGLMENYETSRPFQSGVFDLSLNIEYEKEQVLFRTGLGVQATSNADIVVSERAKVYGFGITTHQNNLSYQSLYDIYIPVELGYTLNNTSFGFGTQLNYLLTTTMNYQSLENKVVTDEYKIKGFDEGLNAITAQGYVWLEQKLTDRFVVGIKVGTNLNSRIKEGRYFNESATTNPLYGQITLRYNLNK